MLIETGNVPEFGHLAHRRRSAVWLVPLVLFLATFFVYGVTAERHVVANDAYAASVGAWRIATTGHPWLDGVDVQRLGGTGNRGSWIGEAPNGHVVVQRMGGPIIAGVPFYFLLDRHPDPRRFSITAGGIAAACMSAVAVLLLFLSLRRKLNDSLALAAALAFAFATPTWTVSADALWTHPVTQLGIAGAAWALSRGKYWVAGVFLGCGMFGRPHVAVIAAVLGLGLAWSRKSWRPIWSLSVPTLAALGLLELWNRYNFGVWSIGGAYGDGRISQVAEGYGGTASSQQMLNYLGFLFSGDRGFLVWSPVLLVLLPAVLRAWRELPAWSKWLVVGGAAYTVIQLRLNYFAGGNGFIAYRLGLELLTCLTPAFALALPYSGRVARTLSPLLLAGQFAALTVGATVNAFGIPLEDVWVDNSFWFALRTNPVVLGTWLALCLLVGAVASFKLTKLSRPRPASRT